MNNLNDLEIFIEYLRCRVAIPVHSRLIVNQISQYKNIQNMAYKINKSNNTHKSYTK